ncbi:MAG TPA: hypothetical protein PKH90_12540 [Candidatus Desulfobacillus denitrificans]|nr:hypothetical protein [Candidatus Desulfobacillus denitrificans]
MKRYEILQDFKGSQTGGVTEQFTAGTEAELSDYLAGIVVPEGWARPIPDEGAQDAAVPSAKPPRKGKGKAE